jgi:tyrosyl-tRNA synthetase
MKFEEELEELKNNFEILVPIDGLSEKLKWSFQKKTPLRIKLGFDPTAPDLHIGHAVVLKKLRVFQDLGHKVIIIIGDFTACIGDPTGRNKTRLPLTPEEIKDNATTYLNQLSKIIDLSKAEIHFNSEWLDKLNLRDTIRLISTVTLAQILQREDFSNRFKNNIPIHFHELIYPIIQGYDSLMIDSDVEIGGTDQLFNCLVGRDIQSSYQKKQQVVACVPILRGTDGIQKMSKSLKNYIGLTDDPNNMYGKVMSIPDNLIEEYTRLISDFSSEKIQTILASLSQETANLMSLKKELAFNITKQFHGIESAEKAGEHFYKQVQSRDEDLIEFKPVSLQQLQLQFPELTMITLCSAIFPDKSKSELRRIMQGGGVSVNSEKITDPLLIIEKLTQEDFNLKIGKRDFYQIILNKI